MEENQVDTEVATEIEQEQAVSTESTAEPVESNAPAEDTRPAWMRALDEVSADELRKHPKYSGILGTAKQQWEAEQKAAREAEIRAENEAARVKAMEEAEKELDELYNRNPLEFADRKYNEDQIKRAQARMARLQEDARKDIAAKVGEAYGADPVFQAVMQKPENHAELINALQGVPEDRVIAVWNATAAKLMARHIGESQAEERIQERLKQERAAWETEAAANGLITSARPQLLRGRGVANLDPEPNWQKQPKEWDAWYERNKRQAG